MYSQEVHELLEFDVGQVLQLIRLRTQGRELFSMRVPFVGADTAHDRNGQPLPAAHGEKLLYGVRMLRDLVDDEKDPLVRKGMELSYHLDVWYCGPLQV